MTYPQDFEQRIGFDRVREMLLSRAQTNAARRKVENIAFSNDPRKLHTRLSLLLETRNALQASEPLPRSGFRDLDFLPIIRATDGYLQPEQILTLARGLEIALAYTKFFASDEKRSLYPLLARLTAPIADHADTLDEINRIIDQHGGVRDSASPELGQIRRELMVKSGQVASKLSTILRRAQEAGHADPEAQISMRDGRAVIPITAGSKRKVEGLIHDESATGKTAYIEPVEIVIINNEIRELQSAEKREIVRILTAFTESLREDYDDLQKTAEFLAFLELFIIKALYAIEIAAVMPIIEQQPNIYLREARHPLLEKSLAAEKKSIVPLNIRLDNRKHILLISGPNAGGKSVCLKTVGLLQYMFQCGLLIPALENSELGIFDRIFIDIGDQQSLENDLSTYSSHLTNMKYFLRNATPKTLILIDEFGGGTEPNIGGAIAQAVLEKLRMERVFAIITTHYANLKYYATAAEGIENGAMTFDVQHIAPLFALEQGRAGSSFALEIATKIGLPNDIINDAKQMIGIDQVQIEKQLRDAARDKQYWENKREKIRETEKQVDQTATKYSDELEKIRDTRSDIVARARAEAAEILASANREIERTIREIRESQADKERTRAAREHFTQFKDTLLSSDDPSDTAAAIERKMAKLRRRQENKVKEATATGVSKASTAPKEVQAMDVGTKVRMTGQTAVGEIISLSGKRATVAFAGITTQMELTRLVAASSDEIRRDAKLNTRTNTQTLNTLKRKIEFTDSIDLRGERAEAAIEAVKLLIDDALIVSATQLRILHGKGNGILKDQIRAYLATEPAVKSFQDEHVERGGAGITIVNLG